MFDLDQRVVQRSTEGLLRLVLSYMCRIQPSDPVDLVKPPCPPAPEDSSHIPPSTRAQEPRHLSHDRRVIRDVLDHLGADHAVDAFVGKRNKAGIPDDGHDSTGYSGGVLDPRRRQVDGVRQAAESP